MLRKIGRLVAVLAAVTLNSCSQFTLTTPMPVDESQAIRHLALRVVVMDNQVNVPIVTNEYIQTTIDFTNTFFTPFRVRLFIESMEVVPFNVKYDRYWVKCDAEKHPNQISVYFLPSYSMMSFWVNQNGDVSNLAGYSAWPWESMSHGVMVFPVSAEKFTLAHELGHYFGLYHTHDVPDDLVPDTKAGEDPYYDNFMNYTSCADRTITPGQIARMNFFLVNYRSQVIRAK